MYTKAPYLLEGKKTFSNEVYLPFETLVDLLESRTLQQPDQLGFTFLTDGENQEVHLTYKQLDLQARAIAASLQAHVSVGERVLLLYPSGLEYIAAFFGCLYAGVIAIPVYPPKRNHKMSRLEAIVADAKATVALTVTPLLDNIQARFAKHSELAKLPCLATDSVASSQATNWQKPNLDRDTIAFLQYTSGSTGSPKGVIVSHENLLYNEQMIKIAFGHTEQTIFVGWLPLFHDMGLIGNVLQPLYLGIPCILMSPEAFIQKPIRWLQGISRYKATTSGGPNFAYDLCLRTITPEQMASLDLSSWEIAFNGAEPIRASTIEQFTAKFADCGFRREAFYPCYGMAETTLLVSGGLKTEPPIICQVTKSALEQDRVIVDSDEGEDIQEIVSCGQSWLKQKIAIVDPNSLTLCPPGHIGEIWVSGPNVARGYWNQLEETKENFQNIIADTGEEQFLRTGDLGFIKHEQLFITGRLKDLIIIRGRNHYPQDIEFTVEQSAPTLRSHSGAAFTVSIDGEEQLVVIQEVERQHLRKINVDEVSACIRRAVAEEHELQIYDVVLIRPLSIPKTSSGKIQRSACRKKYLNNEFEVVKGSTKLNKLKQQYATDSGSKLSSSYPMDFIENWMKVWIANKANVAPKKISSTSQFVDYGLDSVQAVELATEVEKLSGLRLAEGVIFIYPTIRELTQHILHRLGNDVDQLIVTLNKISLADTLETTDLDYSPSTQFRSLADIPSEYYQFNLLPEYLELKETLSIYESGQLKYPYFRAKQKSAKSTMLIDDQEYIDFSSFDYLRLSSDPDVVKAAQLAIERYGTSAGASRIVSGETPLHKELEETIAAWLGTEDAMVFGHGHATNVYAISSIVGPNDLIVHDKYMHNSAAMGSKLSGATIIPFPHNDLKALDKILEQKRLHYQRVLILVEGVYSMDGDILSDLPKLIEIKEHYKAWLFIDEAHSIGVLGETGRGVGEHFEIDSNKVDIWMGTISKALGSSGGYIAGCKSLISYLKHSSPGFLFTVGASPANVAAGLAAIRKVQAEPQLVAQLKERAKLFLELAKQKGLNTGTSNDSGIIPIIVGNSDRAAKLADAAYKRGINVFPIGYPAVEFNQARLRFFISPLHTEDQLNYTVETIAELLMG
ncbi:MAG: aminotransferase class I/II-fold pyridoxal phosphate-dependent enzyme [Moorea sp. SIO1G6]|uniref:aminotransferase class I/II-fold pyridoxal phosphate-dependent enzyme n=1 Tax=Moorena sp. SIO1G6 TaxID=2607840 RepID=UPI0013BF291B|nr:aminotransferase class I/II-fold pyridoxal phosphate-dependent enzyme [Moorena sp. SIO1G6]NET68792.1 aminotransferase class I/II-fold pyridoxal phosphate-dependent enzyme [Moorena sp. SIO1G6]